MTQATDPTTLGQTTDTDLVTALQRVLQESPEPMTLSKIRASLPAQFRPGTVEELAEVLGRQAAANVLYQFPKYRSQQDRFWDRPMPVHVVALLEKTLAEGPLPWSDLRRKLPAYALTQAESVLEEQVAQGKLYRHPRTGRGGERFSVRPPDPKDYLRSELAEVFQRLEQLGFSEAQLRAGALELLHDEEWAIRPRQTDPPTPDQRGHSGEPQGAPHFTGDPAQPHSKSPAASGDVP
jgi:hypothetical protein